MLNSNMYSNRQAAKDLFLYFLTCVQSGCAVVTAEFPYLAAPQFKDNIGSFHIAIMLPQQNWSWLVRWGHGGGCGGGSAVQLFSQDAFWIVFLLGGDHIIRLNHLADLGGDATVDVRWSVKPVCVFGSLTALAVLR